MFPKSSSKKGQTALEFLIMISLAMLVFVAFYATFSRKQTKAIARETRLRGNAIADRVAYELNLALVQDDGFSKKFQIPNQLSGRNYNLSINRTDAGSVILFYWGDQFLTTTTAAPRVEGQVRPGTNQIKKRGGVLYLSQPD